MYIYGTRNCVLHTQCPRTSIYTYIHTLVAYIYDHLQRGVSGLFDINGMNDNKRSNRDTRQSECGVNVLLIPLPRNGFIRRAKIDSRPKHARRFQARFAHSGVGRGGQERGGRGAIEIEIRGLHGGIPRHIFVVPYPGKWRPTLLPPPVKSKTPIRARAACAAAEKAAARIDSCARVPGNLSHNSIPRHNGHGSREITFPVAGSFGARRVSTDVHGVRDLSRA